MADDFSVSGRRQPPRFVPTLTEVVAGESTLSTPHDEPVLPQQPVVALPVEPGPTSTQPVAPHAAWPVDAMVESVVERALDDLIDQLADRLELHLATRMAQWRNEQAQAWVREWLHAEMDGQLSDVRIRLEQLAQEIVARHTPR